MMENFRRSQILILGILICSWSGLGAQESKTFEISKNGTVVPIRIDSNDATAVKTAVEIFADDVNKVTGKKPAVQTARTNAKKAIIIGSLNGSQLIKTLQENGKINTGQITGKWETFLIEIIDQPLAGMDQALVVAGSDRRGTAFGVFELSKRIGVSPWVYWADAVPEHQENLSVDMAATIVGPPSVKYRGIFINDEDWGLKPWAANNYEKELRDIGPKTYAQVCELLLRLKANMFAPAMHSCTGAFYSHAESKVVADKYGIIITTSHCEPLLFNNAAKSEWDTARDGEWNYFANKDTIIKKLDDRVAEAWQYENIYTMGMRGLHDEGLRGNLSNEEKVRVLEEVMAKQRDILTKYINKSIEEIPQIFVPYKETLDIYQSGLNVPDDITIVWADDNYGYIKHLSDPQERKRTGGAGVYYHTSYLGTPHDYLWLCTTPPVLMYSEMKKAYDVDAKIYWLVNVGDIKPAELFMELFFDFAWDVGKYDFDSINTCQSKFLAEIFGEKYRETFQDILDNYYRLAWSRKPEYMGWEWQWDSRNQKLSDTDFSFQNYNDARQRLADYKRIAELTDSIYQQLPGSQKPAFFQLLVYPVKGAYQMNLKFLLAQLSNEQAKTNQPAKANWAAGQSENAYDEINRLTDEYNHLLDGKWAGMMDVPPGFVSKYHQMPEVSKTAGAGIEPVDIAPDPGKNKLEGCTVINLKNYKNKVEKDGHTIRMINGIGYDWQALQLGWATQESVDPKNLNGSRVEYEFSGVDSDNITVYVYSVPAFPLHKGKSNQFGVSVDGQNVYVSKNEPSEWSFPWKERVMQNSEVDIAKFKIDPAKDKHTLTLTVGDPGMIIQRIVLDWGGLKETYVGPRAALSALD